MSAPAADERTLAIDLVLDAPRTAIWRCWTEPALLTRWFTPAPWTTAAAELDVRPGGSSIVMMRGPNGEEVRNEGVYLDVVPNERLVFTDAYTRAWEPSAAPFMTGEIVLSDADAGRTRYLARAHHWSTEDRDRHAAMGFHEGWTQAARQLEALARTL
jgi:uncharacterized protein YndB with AHSA1/START domain